MNMDELKRRRAALIDEAAGLAAQASKDGRDLTAEEIQKFDANMDAAERLEADIARAERLEKAEASIKRPTQEPMRPDLAGRRPRPATPVLDYGYDQARQRWAPPWQGGGPFHAPILSETGPFRTLGEQLQAVARSSASGATVDPRLYQVADQFMAATGMSEGLPSDGGFLVQQDFSAELYRRAYDMGEITRRCRRVPISSNANSIKLLGVDETSRATGSRWGGIRGYWLAEAGTLTLSQPKFRKIELDLKKLAVLAYATDELLQDAAALESIVGTAASEEISFMTEDAIVNGDGSGKPLGIMAAPCIISVAKETGQAAATIVTENISKMWARLWGRSRANAIWLYSQDCEPQFDMLNMAVGTGGMVVYMPPGGIADAPVGRLKGRPMFPVEYCAAVGTTGDLIAGDFSQYLLADKAGIQAASSMHVQFTTDEMVFRFIYRVDGEPAWSSALTPKNAGSTLSCFVKLDTRS